MESPTTHHYSQQPSPTQALPSITSLTNGLPPMSGHATHNVHGQQMPARDSGAFLGSQSKHSSLNNGLHVSTLLNPDESHTRSSVPSTPTSARVSHPGQTLPSITQGHEHHQQRQSNEYYNTQESRRSSVDSRVQSGINNLSVNPLSPYQSQHASQLSLAASLRRPEGASQLSPISSRTHARAVDHSTRVAPPIVPNPRQFGAPDPTSAKPTQGFPWAFPDSTDPITGERTSRRASSSESDESQKISRPGSYANSSMRSSVFSAEGPLPQGQRRFEDGMAFQKIIGTAPLEVPSREGSITEHHPSLQHRSITALQNEHAGAGSTGGYSRTPELRVSHKLAERKRRSEMKDLFEELNKAVPTNGGAKASKWEVLSKAIDYIRSTRETEMQYHDEINRLRADLEFARDLYKENEQLKTETSVMHERLRRVEPGAPHIYGSYTSQLTQQQQQSGQHVQAPSQMNALPPMSSAHAHHQSQQPQQHPAHYAAQSMSHGAPMQGVEYALPTRPSYEVR